MCTMILCRIFCPPVCYQKIQITKIYKTITLPVALYGRESWSFTLTEERRPSFSENRMLRRIFGSKRDEVTGE